MGFSNLSEFPELHTGFKILRCTKFDIPNSSGKYQKPRIHLSLELEFYFGKTVVMQISQLFMFQAPHTWFIVAQVMSFSEWLSIIARSKLGSDLDCSVINARSVLGSDLDCYELTGECAAQKLKNFCSSSLWTCLHHMVILRSQNKINDFFMILA